MQSVTIERSAPIKRSARVVQVEGMFDVPAEEISKVHWTVNLPELRDDDSWNVGLIVGPSGAGKTTIAHELFDSEIIAGFDWPRDACILDGFDKGISIKDITGALTAVGFGTVPNWLRPFHVLSNGEQFRATLARSLTLQHPLFVMDEFTSVVDRQVAQAGSYTVQKSVRRANKQFVAVACHYDIIDWLQPDWIYEPHLDEFQRRSVQPRPEINLTIRKISRDCWSLFAKYHYLSRTLANAAQCFGAFIDDEKLVGFTSYLHFPHPKTKTIKHGHRLVVLPDYQGLGIGGTLDNWLGAFLYDKGLRYQNVVAHPAMVAFYNKSPRWKCTRKGKMSAGSKKTRHEASIARTKQRQFRFSSQRISYTFSYVPEPK